MKKLFTAIFLVSIPSFSENLVIRIATKGEPRWIKSPTSGLNAKLDKACRDIGGELDFKSIETAVQYKYHIRFPETGIVFGNCVVSKNCK